MSAIENVKLNRRGFLKISTAAAGGLLVGFYLPGRVNSRRSPRTLSGI